MPMTWRVLEHEDAVWSVSCAAERPPHRDDWRLVLAFRREGSAQAPFWVEGPIQAPSRADVFARAERLSDEALVSVLSGRLR